MYIYHPSGVLLAGFVPALKERFYTLILKLMYIIFYLLTEPQAMLQLKILMV